MPAPCTMVFGFCWMKSGVAAIVLPIVIIDQPMTILAVWPAWSAPRLAMAWNRYAIDATFSP